MDRTLSERPLVSYIVPTYNRPDLLRRALESIGAQEYSRFEAVVVNDAGQDVSGVVGDFPFARLVNHGHNLGLSAARNTGINAGEGEFLCYLDDDDYLYPDHTVVLLGALLGGHRAGYSDAAVLYNNGPPRLYMSNNWDAEHLKRGNLFPVCCAMHERSLIDQVGYFDERLPSHEDWDLWIRMSEICDFVHVPMMTCVVDQSHQGMMHDANIMNRGHKLVLEKYG
ncbi:MAG: glycosyltransferase family 2 protein [Planctomycetota bacterium]